MTPVPVIVYSVFVASLTLDIVGVGLEKEPNNLPKTRFAPAVIRPFAPWVTIPVTTVFRNLGFIMLSLILSLTHVSALSPYQLDSEF